MMNRGFAGCLGSIVSCIEGKLYQLNMSKLCIQACIKAMSIIRNRKLALCCCLKIFDIQSLTGIEWHPKLRKDLCIHIC